MNCLSSDDEALKRKAIDLLFAISNENNVQVVIDKMLDFLKTTNDEYFQILLITRVNDLGGAASRPTPRGTSRPSRSCSWRRATWCLATWPPP